MGRIRREDKKVHGGPVPCHRSDSATLSESPRGSAPEFNCQPASHRPHVGRNLRRMEFDPRDEADARGATTRACAAVGARTCVLPTSRAGSGFGRARLARPVRQCCQRAWPCAPPDSRSAVCVFRSQHLGQPDLLFVECRCSAAPSAWRRYDTRRHGGHRDELCKCASVSQTLSVS